MIWTISHDSYDENTGDDQVIGALIIAKLLQVPLVLSYHTHVPVYVSPWVVFFVLSGGFYAWVFSCNWFKLVFCSDIFQSILSAGLSNRCG